MNNSKLPTDQIGSSKPYQPPPQPTYQQPGSSKPYQPPPQPTYEQPGSSKPYQPPPTLTFDSSTGIIQPIKDVPQVPTAVDLAVKQLNILQKKLYDLTEKTGRQLLVDKIDKKAIQENISLLQLAVKLEIPKIISTLQPPRPTFGSSKSFFGSSGSSYTWILLIAVAVFLYFYLKKKKMF